jgi:hypothetical protein
VFDPDTKKMGKRARFALAHGQQVSANLARGGARESLAYQHQLYSFPRQARLGRVWNTAEQHWDTSHDVIRRIGRVTVGGPRSPIRKFRNARYTKPTAREAKIVAHSIDNFLNSFGNLPPIHVVDNVTQLPENLQRRIAINPGNGSSTAGIMNDDDPEDGVYIVMAGLIDSTDRLIREGKMKPEMREAWLAHRARTVALHELVGHWGIRAVMGSDARLEAWMERILIDHEPEVVATAIRRGLMIADPNGKQYMGRDGKPLTDEAGNTKFLWPDHNSRMTAPQEYLAEIAQKKILKLEVSIHERGLLKSIVGAIKSFLIERGFGRFVTVTDDDIEHLIWKSKQFIDSGRAHVYHKGWDGSRRGLMTRDADLFTSAFVNAVESGRRVPSPAEKQQLRAAGIALAPDGMVDLFPKEGLTRAGYQNAIAYMLKNGLASEAEINFMDLEGFVEIVTPWMIWTAGEGKSLPRHAQELGYKMQGFNLFPEDQQDLGKMIKHRDELRAIKKRLESPLTDESYEALIEFHLIDTMPDAPTPQQAAEQLGWQLEGLEAQIGTRFGTGWGSSSPSRARMPTGR